MSKKTIATPATPATPVDVVPAVRADIEMSIGTMFADVTEKNVSEYATTEKTETGREVIALKVDTVNKKGEKVHVDVTDVADIGYITRIRSASVANKVSSLAIAANGGALWSNGDVKKKYGVTSAEGLNDVLKLGIGKDNARKWFDVGRKFLKVVDGVPAYKSGIPELPVSTLVYLCPLVEVDKETGAFNYDKFNDFIDKAGITALSSQADVRKAIADKKAPVEGTAKEKGTVKTDAVSYDNISRGGRIDLVKDAVDTIRRYVSEYGNADFEDMDDIITRLDGYVENQINARNTAKGDDLQTWEKV